MKALSLVWTRAGTPNSRSGSLALDRALSMSVTVCFRPGDAESYGVPLTKSCELATSVLLNLKRSLSVEDAFSDMEISIKWPPMALEIPFPECGLVAAGNLLRRCFPLWHVHNFRLLTAQQTKSKHTWMAQQLLA